MAQLDVYRTFLAVYRAASLTAGARARHLTQPAVSQQLAALEALVGAPLFVRTPRGVRPTARGQELYAQVFEAVDRLERVSRGLRGQAGPLTLRLGSTPEYLHGYALERLSVLDGVLSLRLGEPRELLAALETGDLDAVAAPLKPGSRALEARLLHLQHYILIAPPHFAPPAQELPPAELAAWLSAQPWVSYSAELPVTRRFWRSLGGRFEAALRLTVPDLRSVLRAVELGYGLSIVPDFVVTDALALGRVRELVPLARWIAPESWWLAFRTPDEDRPELQALTRALARHT